ncbi:MAG: monovalent cation/H(+) antiporter subunit G [Hyphomonadaceae bacterium]
MLDLLYWIGGGAAVAGVMLSILGSVGVLRFPDVYTRIHAASITDTGGATLVLLGLGLISGLTAVTTKLVIIWLFILLTTPAAANALANAAYSSGHHPRIGTFQLMRTDERRKTPRGSEEP